VLTILRAHNGDSDLFDEVSYCAPAQARQTEVDFLLRHGREFLAIEVKAHSRFSTPQLAGLRAIGELPRLVRRILVYLGDRQLRTEDGIEVWRFGRFTAAVAERSLWP
jgi:predicted AAA+ superfamily ATPase